MSALATVALAESAPGQRVAVLHAEPELVRALADAGRECQAFEAPEQLSPFAPQLVVLGEDLADLTDPRGALRWVADAVEAKWMMSLRHAGSATALLRELSGAAGGPRTLSRAEVEQWCADAGLSIHRAEPMPADAPAPASGERALHRLLTQLSPIAAAEQLVLVIERRPTRSREAKPGLLSVVLWADEATDPAALDQTLFSLACQEHRPLELVAEGPPPLAERYRPLGGYDLVPAPKRGSPLAVSGQYVAFLSPGWAVYPAHYRALIEALRREDAAWALARARKAVITGPAEGPPFIQKKLPFPLGEAFDLRQLAAWPELGWALVVDRTRIGPVALPRSPEEVAGFALRLAALSRPAFVGGLGSCEQLVREEATTTSAPEDLQLVVGLRELLEWLAHAKAEGESTRGSRYALVDRLNAGFKQRAPWLHSAVKALLDRR